MIAVDDPATAAGPTPRRVFLAAAARERFALLARLRDELSRPGLRAIAGYSVKTNPRRELMQLACEHGLYAEIISPEELAWAEESGFARDAVIANGPHPLAPGADAAAPLAYAFADSLEAFGRNVRGGVARVLGVRLRPSMLESRFGVPVEDDPALHAAVGAAALEGVGVSFHARRGDFHGASWADVAGDVLERAAALERASGRPVVAFDAGGGWTPEEFDATFARDVGAFADRIRERLPRCATLIVEPGQAICTPCEALVTTVLEVRERRGRREAVIDAGYPDWPLMHSYVHELRVLRGEREIAIGTGPDRLLGRTCLEYDLVEGVRFPADLIAGERILIGGTGSYDASMSFTFARGAQASADRYR